jgi:hypothetical protein
LVIIIIFVLSIIGTAYRDVMLSYRGILDGLVKSRKTDFLPQHIGIMQGDNTICCGQNKMLGLFTRPSFLFRQEINNVDIPPTIFYLLNLIDILIT